MDERRWQLAQGAENDARIQDAIGIIKNLVAQDSHFMVDEIENRVFQKLDYDEEHRAPGLFKNLLKSSFFQDLPGDLKAESVAGFVAERGSWKYGLHDDEAPSLIDGAVASRTMPLRPSDGLVLSGLAGSELIGKRRKLDTIATSLEANPLHRAVLLGGIGLVAAQRHWDRDPYHEGATYIGARDAHIVEKTTVSASTHGDFQIIRSASFSGPVSDPLMRPQEFGPALPETGVYAYHSVEPEILADVLKHVVLRGGDIRTLGRTVTERWNALGERPSYAGPYGDFGYDDGRWSASNLRYWLDQPHDDVDGNIVLSRLVVMPQGSETMTISSEPDGVRLHHETRESDGILIRNHEIEDFIMALFEQTRRGLGRTSTDALVSVMNVLE